MNKIFGRPAGWLKQGRLTDKQDPKASVTMAVLRLSGFMLQV